MTRFEKLFVNREIKGRRNVARVIAGLDELDPLSIRDVLEIGCGIGTASAKLAETHPWRIVGTDFDPAQIEAARRRYGETDGLRFQREDATQLSFPTDSFDFAFAQNVFHHIPDWPAAVHELARVIRPGGFLFWSDFVVPSRMRRVLLPLTGWLGVCTREDVRRAFAESGFTLERERRATPTGVTFDELLLRLES